VLLINTIDYNFPSAAWFTVVRIAEIVIVVQLQLRRRGSWKLASLIRGQEDTVRVMTIANPLVALAE
jgi:hypothetical protein